jgi:hypothetical protein
MLADEIRRAQIKALDDGESAIAQSATDLCAAPELATGDLELLQPWLRWCKEKSVRHCPAKPYSVAAFILDQHKLGQIEGIFDTLAAIERLHDKFTLANPVLTPIVGVAIERTTTIKSPRSWPKADCALAATLPPQIRWRIETREQERDAGLRRKHNELAELRKKLEQQIDSAKPVEQKEKVD